MLKIFGFGKRRAEKLHAMAMALDAAGSTDDAIAKYREAIQADLAKSESHYNLGLIYKYRSEWLRSFESNYMAYGLAPDDQAARWNLAIAATALHDWTTARRMWRDEGITLDEELGPINGNYGQTPVRLHPDGDAEVVWARRIDPVRARIENIPFPESGFRCGDVVLHDGAAVGYRMRGERECPVFNVLELFERSRLGTFQLLIDAPSPEVVDALIDAFDEAGVAVEDWTENVRILCKACSEGAPHTHDENTLPDAWQSERRLGVAAASMAEVEAVLNAWMGTEFTVLELRCELTAEN